MRIAMVSEHASPLAVLGGEDAGGQNVHVAALATALAARGHTVEVHTRRDDPALPGRVPLCAGADVVHVDAGPPRPVPKDALAPWMPAFGDDLARRWTAGPRPDLVHAHFWMSGKAALRARARTGVPVVQTFHALGTVKRRHQGSADTSPPERLGVEARIAAEADRLVATCTDEVAELVAIGAGPGRIDIVPCGVDTDLFTPDGPRAPRRGLARLVAVGRLVERKGLGTAVEALALLPDTELVVAGGPAPDELARDPEARRLQALAGRLGVADRLVLAGRLGHDELPVLLRSADVVVAVPAYEPFGIVPLEAAACGVPVVGSAVGGLLDTVLDGRTGTLVPPGDATAVAGAVRHLLDDPARRAAMGRAARDRVVTRYTWERVAAGTEAAYRRVLAGTGDGAGDPVEALLATGGRR